MLKRLASVAVLILLFSSTLIFVLKVSPVHAQDTNQDGYVNVQDVMIVTEAFGSYPGHPRWDPRADVNDDEIVNMLDVGIVVREADDTDWRAPDPQPGPARLETNPEYLSVEDGESFNVTVSVFDVTGLAGYQFKLFYDTAVLDLVSATSTSPFSNSTTNDTTNDSYSGSLGRYFHLCYYNPNQGASPVTGDFDLVTLTFNCTFGGSSFFDLTDTLLADAEAEQIRHSREGIYDDRGPQLDTLYIKYFGGRNSVFNALQNAEVDITNLNFNQTEMDEMVSDPAIQAAISSAPIIYQFDLNNNDTIPSYPNFTSPTAYKEFRQGIAFLVDKNDIVNNILSSVSSSYSISYRIDTPIPRPNHDWWVDWSVSQYDSYGGLLGNYPYEYDPDLAAYYFDQSGFLEGDAETGTPNPYYDPSFPSSAQYLRQRYFPPSGNQTILYEDLEPLIFYIRNDSNHNGRLQVGRILRDNLRKMGIPVNAYEANMSTCYNEVMVQGDYHIYTGGWIHARGWSTLSTYSSLAPAISNYPQFRNATYDDWIEKVVNASDLSLARHAAQECQKILVEEAVCVWLWSPSYVMGYRTLYGVVNAIGEGIYNQWTLLHAFSSAGSDIRFGVSYSPSSLNVVTDFVSMFVDPIYDTLLSYCPYDRTPGNSYEEGDRGGTMPWMAEEWELAKWESPYDPGENLTKLTFYLREGIRWHDGVRLTSSDVKFTIEYLQQLGSNSSLFSSVRDVHHVTTPDSRTVVVYENVSNIWTLDTIGTLPILPEHIFQDITNVTGYTPGADEGLAPSEAMIGSGPWKYVFHNDSMLILEANRNYFMEKSPKPEVDFRYDWEVGSWAVDSMDATMVAEAFGTTGNRVPDAGWEPGCDMNGDCQVDLFDIVTLALEFNATWGRSATRGIILEPTATAMYIEHENPVLVGENVTVHVKLRNLTRMTGFQFKLNYDNSKLDCLDLDVAPVFSGSGNSFKEEVNQTNGFVWVSVSSLGAAQQVSGNTTLASVTFNATMPSGSTLDLWNTKLAVFGAPGSTCQPTAHAAIDRSVMVGVSTPTGTNVTVSPAENANVTFPETTVAGVTTLNITEPPSPEFTDVLCHDVETTAVYAGNVTIEFAYSPIGRTLESELAMKIWLWNETSSVWMDITTGVDTDKNIVYGIAPHLSMFGVTSNISFEGEELQGGETVVSTPASPPSPPPGLVFIGCYEVESTIVYSWPILARVEFAGVPAGEEDFVQMWLWNELQGRWDDVTVLVDTVNDVVKGEVPHLSMFGVTMRTPSPPEIAILDPECSPTEVVHEYDVTIDFTVKNLGDFTETFDLIVYCNSTVLETQPLTLTPGEQTPLTFMWDTATWEMGRYAVTANNHLISWVDVIPVIGILDPACSKTVIAHEYEVVINFTVKNQGYSTETFDLIVYCNSTVLETQPLTLTPGEQTRLHVIWNTTMWEMGRYAVTAEDQLISWVSVTIPGDVDGNFFVEIKDILAIAIAYGVVPSDPDEGNLDVNCDVFIDIKDILAAAINYGQSFP